MGWAQTSTDLADLADLTDLTDLDGLEPERMQRPHSGRGSS